MKRHELKTWPHPFQAVVEGTKRFEWRRNDRDFQRGDRLLLKEWDPAPERYTGRDVEVKVTYILGGHFDGGVGEQLGVPEGYVVMSIEPLRASLNTSSYLEEKSRQIDEAAQGFRVALCDLKGKA